MKFLTRLDWRIVYVLLVISAFAATGGASIGGGGWGIP